MLLQKLVEYSERLTDIAPPGYAAKPVRYLIELDNKGNLRNPHPIDLSDQKNKRGVTYVVPNVVRASAVKPLLLVDNAEYTLNLPRAVEKIARTEQCHKAYIELLTECIQATGNTSAEAVLQFLKNEPLNSLIISEDFDREGTTLG